MPERFILRNDNESQFIASQVQEHFAQNNIIQEFTKSSTPQQNGHIESYHSIMVSAICQRLNLDEFFFLFDIYKTFNSTRRFF